MPAILLTRPQTTSAQLAKELQRRGYACVIEPLLSISPTQISKPQSKNIQAVMITSANALTALEEGDYNADPLLSLPCFCVGSRTADKALAYGFQQTQSSKGDGAELARLITSKLTDKSKAILHIAGRDTDAKASTELQKLGFTVSTWPIYTAEPSSALTQGVIQQLQMQKLNAVLVFSARTAMTLNTLIKQHALQTCCKSLIAIGLSDTVADVLKQMPWQKVIAAKQPTEDAVIQCLTETLPVS